jgi:uncharacterized protein YndB with AHSA1/START domain
MTTSTPSSRTVELPNAVRRRVSVPPDRVFAVLADGWLYASWVVGAARMRDVDPEWPSVGSRLHHSFGLWPLMLNDVTEVAEYDPPHRMVLQARGWPAGEAAVTVVVAPDVGGGSEITLGEDATHGPGALIPAPIRTLGIATRNRETLRRLAYLAEGRAPHS